MKAHFQFHKVQFRAGTPTVPPPPPRPFNSTRSNSETLPKASAHTLTPLSIPQGPIQSGDQDLVPSLPLTFNSTRSNSEAQPARCSPRHQPLSIPQGPIQSTASIPRAAGDLRFQFHKVQFRGLTCRSFRPRSTTFNSTRSNSEARLDLGRSYRPSTFNSTRSNSEVSKALSMAALRRLSIPQGPIQRRVSKPNMKAPLPFQFHKVQFRVVPARLLTLGRKPFNSTRSNSELRGRLRTPLRSILSIPQGPIQSRDADRTATATTPFQFHKVQFREGSSKPATTWVPPFNSTRSNSEWPYLFFLTLHSRFQFHKVQFRGWPATAKWTSPTSFNSTRSNSEARPTVRTSMRPTFNSTRSNSEGKGSSGSRSAIPLSIPQGPIQRPPKSTAQLSKTGGFKAWLRPFRASPSSSVNQWGDRRRIRSKTNGIN